MKQCFFHDAPDNQRDSLLFDIAEREYRGKNRVLVFAAGNDRAAELDRMLWDLRSESFIPHRIFEPGEQIGDAGDEVHVGIVTTEENPIKARVLIADGHCGLDFACSFDTAHEFVDHSSPDRTERCRRRYGDYRDLRKVPVRHLKS